MALFKPTSLCFFSAVPERLTELRRWDWARIPRLVKLCVEGGRGGCVPWGSGSSATLWQYRGDWPGVLSRQVEQHLEGLAS